MKLKIGKLKLKRAGHLAYPLTVGKLTVAIAIDVFCLTALLQRQLMYSCTGWLAVTSPLDTAATFTALTSSGQICSGADTCKERTRPDLKTR